MKVANIFDKVARKMRADIDEARDALTHAGLKGGVFEETFRRFLKAYLPSSLDVSTGQIIDSYGNISRQIDVIVSDTAKTPIFYREGDVRVVPVECVYATIEVKANLDTAELEKSIANMESVRKPKKTAYLPENNLIIRGVEMYGREWDIWPINYYVFAYDSIDMRALTATLINEYEFKRLPEYSRIDTICVLDKGVITNKLIDGNVNALPEPGSRLAYIKTKRSLLLFHALTSRFFNQTWLPNFRFLDYIQEMTFGEDEPE